MRFKILYVILLTSTLVFGGIHLLGSIVVLYVASIFIAIACFFEKVSFPHNAALKLYTIFVAIYSLSCILHGYLLFWTSSMIGYYIISYIWIWATYILIRKYQSIHVLIYTFLFIGGINAIVTIGQHYMNPTALAIPEFLQKSGSESLDVLKSRMENSDYEFALWGLFDMVFNGYYSSIATVLCVYLSTKLHKIISLLIWAFFATALFFVQERAAFVSGIFFSVLYYFQIIKKSKATTKYFLLLVLFFIPGFYFIEQLNYDSIIEGSRYVSFEMGGRNRLLELSYIYFTSHPFTANLYDFFFLTGEYPHNLFYNAFIYGTFIGGVIILTSLTIIIIKAMNVIRLSDTKRYNEIVAFSFCLLCYNVICLTHNASIVSGDVLFWLLATPILFFPIRCK